MFKFLKQKLLTSIDKYPIYHDFSFLGHNNLQIQSHFVNNQKSKFPIITAYIALALAKCKTKIDTDVTFTELFCADGFFTMVASKLGASYCYGIDSDKDGHLHDAIKVAKILKMKNVKFIKEDVSNLDKLQRTDIVANIGGLYHVGNPEQILDKSYKFAKKYLIVQNVVSLANTKDDYFKVPAPGWTWGNRYSKESFDKMIRSKGYNIIDSHFNELEGNSRLEDRGSLYYLIKK
jgi:hypothetical protein